ncbi:spore germination protein [Paenibacillus tyrfis]|uniref:spore germination protein n=1 Tax=Paenibacillus tyrfis TaxID=1501230 RepID=UPI00209FD33F|nr:spore germination protein [Paenibacillus tyrfis]MCP1309053.1 spore germination protein [Paenibacillus tyrfis]
MTDGDLPQEHRSRHSEKEWSEASFREWFANCPDVKIDSYSIDANRTVTFVYCEHLCDLQQINETVLTALYKLASGDDVRTVPLQLKPFLSPLTATRAAQAVFGGELLVILGQTHEVFTLNLMNVPKRNPEESVLDVSIRGPRDGFVEDYSVNLALIRKRLRTETLALEEFTLGKRSSTKVGLLYVRDVINPAYVNDVRSRLSQIDLDTLVSPAQLEEWIGEPRFSLFPLFFYTGRPDFVVDSLSRGRFALIVEGGPLAIVAPANLFLIIKSPEDAYFPFWISSMSRILRISGLCISILLPGFWISLAQYNQDQLPFPLLSSITQTRIGLPLPISMELFLMLFLLDLFREAGSRLPKAIGQTLTVVGGIVIGDAAVRAALISPSLLIIASLSSVANYTLSNQALVGGVTIARFIVFLASSFLGMYGFVISIIALVLHLASQQSFGLPYLAPVSPLSVREVITGVLASAWRRLRKRPQILHTQDSTRTGRKKS